MTEGDGKWHTAEHNEWHQGVCKAVVTLRPGSGIICGAQCSHDVVTESGVYWASGMAELKCNACGHTWPADPLRPPTDAEIAEDMRTKDAHGPDCYDPIAKERDWNAMEERRRERRVRDGSIVEPIFDAEHIHFIESDTPPENPQPGLIWIQPAPPMSRDEVIVVIRSLKRYRKYDTFRRGFEQMVERLDEMSAELPERQHLWRPGEIPEGQTPRCGDPTAAPWLPKTAEESNAVPVCVPCHKAAMKIARAEGKTQIVDLLFDGPPGHTAGRFIDAVTQDDKGVSVGEWIRRQDGTWALRIRVSLES